jgi:hypothetical protein
MQSAYVSEIRSFDNHNAIETFWRGAMAGAAVKLRATGWYVLATAPQAIRAQTIRP